MLMITYDASSCEGVTLMELTFCMYAQKGVLSTRLERNQVM